MSTDRYNFPQLFSGAGDAPRNVPSSNLPKTTAGQRNLSILEQFAERVDLGAVGSHVRELIRARRFREACEVCENSARGTNGRFPTDASPKSCAFSDAAVSLEQHRQLVRRNLLRVAIMLQDLEVTRGHY